MAARKEWRRIPGFLRYEVSRDGEIRRNDGAPSPELRHIRNSRGYAVVNLRNFGEKQKRIYVHKAVMLAYVGPVPAGKQCCHNDGNAMNNSLSNLRYDTAKANHDDKKRHGTSPSGERNAMAKLSAADVEQIRANRGFLSGRHLACLFGVSATMISYIQLGKNWKDVARCL